MMAKYIVYLDRKFDKECAVIFDKAMNHIDVANWLGIEKNVLGAGFMVLMGNEVRVYEGSESLKVNNRGQKDVVIIENTLTM